MLQCCCSCDDLVAIMKLEFISMAMCIALRMHCTHRNDVSHCQEADEASPYFCKKRGVPLVAFKVAPKPWWCHLPASKSRQGQHATLSINVYTSPRGHELVLEVCTFNLCLHSLCLCLCLQLINASYPLYITASTSTWPHPEEVHTRGLSWFLCRKTWGCHPGLSSDTCPD